MECSLVFPHQLFDPHPALSPQRLVVLVEEELFFQQYPFHRQKLVFHRASLQAFEARLQAKGMKTRYVFSGSGLDKVAQLVAQLRQEGYDTLHHLDPSDNWLNKRLQTAAQKHQVKLVNYPDPGFGIATDYVARSVHLKKYAQAQFYKEQRLSKKILVDAQSQPLGGQWSFDADNREKFPKGKKPPAFALPRSNPFVQAAQESIATAFPSNPGNLGNPFPHEQPAGAFYPVTHEEAQAWLSDFLEERFAQFGQYEDALVPGRSLLHHSLLSPLLNCGLLRPDQVMAAALACAGPKNIPLNSLEGFLRQIMGWRDFIKALYDQVGTAQRNANFFKAQRQMPAAFWTGTTGIVPVDEVIQKLLASGYNHHIERLMVLGNFMLLCEIDPHEVYRWFMCFYIDAYDWVMVPNVYGMSQFADGGRMATKPYISSSNYLQKMGPYPKGPWEKIWDGLFWRFLQKHRSFFGQNPRLGMLLKTWDKMSPTQQSAHLAAAENFLATLS